MPKKKAEEIAMQNLERVQIADQAKKFPGQLSGGQQTKISFSSCFMYGTKNYVI